ncbi:MAG: DUF58 domain-containing protein [Verrucomicrobiota bacterium]
MNDALPINELIQTVHQVEVAVNRLANDTMVGAYLSSFKGRGMDFEDLRDYAPGDDVRHIDWNVTHRLGRPFVKRYREEREFSLILLVDVSASGEFGSANRSKRRLATEVAGTLAFAAARCGDKVGLLLFTNEVELFLPPAKGRSHLLRVLREMLFFQPAHRGTNPTGALRAMLHWLTHRSMAILVSDCLCPLDHELTQALGQANARHDLVCLHLYDPCEIALPEVGIARFEDAETGEILEVNLARTDIREQYANSNSQRLAALDLALQREGVDTLRLATDRPFATMLQHFFEHRRWRRA